jgi:hypothetical protein
MADSTINLQIILEFKWLRVHTILFAAHRHFFLGITRIGCDAIALQTFGNMTAATAPMSGLNGRVFI